MLALGALTIRLYAGLQLNGPPPPAGLHPKYVFILVTFLQLSFPVCAIRQAWIRSPSIWLLGQAPLLLDSGNLCPSPLSTSFSLLLNSSYLTYSPLR